MCVLDRTSQDRSLIKSASDVQTHANQSWVRADPDNIKLNMLRYVDFFMPMLQEGKKFVGKPRSFFLLAQL